MTWLDLYNSALIEQNKHEAPTLLIEEYNYLINKAIIQYINLTYARFDLNQQASDDLRWLQRSVELTVYKQSKIIHPGEEANYVVMLPANYLHMLNCVAHFSKICNDDLKGKCPPKDDAEGSGTFSLCRRLTANQIPAIINNAYLKPTYKRPYYYINTSLDAGKITSDIELQNLFDPCKSDCENPVGNGSVPTLKPCCGNSEEDSDLKSMLKIYDLPKEEGRLMELRCGKNKFYSPDVLYVDYLKLPQVINLTWEDVQSIEDTTPECEFPDPVAYEIINIFLKLLLENAGDQRLQTHFAINQTVGGIPTTDSK